MRSAFLFLALAASCGAADITVWRSGDLKAREKELAGKAATAGQAFETLANYGNHLTMLAHRKATGEPELHEKMADIFVVESGEAMLLFGGKINGGRTTAPGEIRGGTIEGGEKQELAAGDVVHIPAGVPHQLLLDKGKSFTYFVVKVEK